MRHPRHSGFPHRRQDCPISEIPFDSYRAQWLLRGFDTQETGMCMVLGFKSVLERTRTTLANNPWVWEGMPEHTSDDAPGFELIKPDTITMDQINVFTCSFSNLFYLDKVMVEDSENDNRLPWDQQPCERFAWLEHSAWAYNMGRGCCGNPQCKRPLRLWHQNESRHTIFDDIGLWRRPPPEDAFTLQRRQNNIVHVGSNISGALCHRCNTAAQDWRGELPEGLRPRWEQYPEFGGPKEFWRITVELNCIQVAAPRRFNTYSALKMRARKDLINEGMVKCSKRGGNECKCPWHQAYRAKLQALTAAVGQTVDELHAQVNEQQLRKRKERKRGIDVDRRRGPRT